MPHTGQHTHLSFLEETVFSLSLNNTLHSQNMYQIWLFQWIMSCMKTGLRNFKIFIKKKNSFLYSTIVEKHHMGGVWTEQWLMSKCVQEHFPNPSTKNKKKIKKLNIANASFRLQHPFRCSWENVWCSLETLFSQENLQDSFSTKQAFLLTYMVCYLF